MNDQHYRFPLFIDLKDKRVTVVGGGTIGLRRAQVLCEFGASVTIIAPECETVPEGAYWVHRTYENGDLEGCALAVAATDQRAVNHWVYKDALELGIPVSVADSAEESTFFFPAICTGGDLVAGVVSQGKSHKKTAQAAVQIRRLLEDMK